MNSQAALRKDPIKIAWTIHCGSTDDFLRVMEVLRHKADSNYVIVDEIRDSSDATELASATYHRIGDYFKEISVNPSGEQVAPSICLVFHPSPNAGRYWKDVMARILQFVRSAGQSVTATFDYREDD